MKMSTFKNILKFAPEKATHYKKLKRCVIFYRNIDEAFGSYDYLTVYPDMEISEVWITKRTFPDIDRITRL